MNVTQQQFNRLATKEDVETLNDKIRDIQKQLLSDWRFSSVRKDLKEIKLDNQISTLEHKLNRLIEMLDKKTN
ncbi:MAG TPA: hypothetical protein VGA49_03500 [Patescibacteria group bacterium]